MRSRRGFSRHESTDRRVYYSTAREAPRRKSDMFAIVARLRQPQCGQGRKRATVCTTDRIPPARKRCRSNRGGI